MKKLLAMLLALAMLFSLAACGAEEGGEVVENETVENETVENETVENEVIENEIVEDDALEQEDVEPPAESVEAIESYIEKLLQTQEMQDVIKQCAANGMLHELEAREHTFVYKYTYLMEIPENAAEVLEAQFAEQEELLIAAADAVKAEESAVKIVAWEYYSIEGVLITAYEC